MVRQTDHFQCRATRNWEQQGTFHESRIRWWQNGQHDSFLCIHWSKVSLIFSLLGSTCTKMAGSTSRLMFSNPELTQDHVLQARILDFLPGAIYIVSRGDEKTVLRLPSKNMEWIYLANMQRASIPVGEPEITSVGKPENIFKIFMENWKTTQLENWRTYPCFIYFPCPPCSPN